MRRIAILGLGLMGGSLGLALKARGFRGTISAYARRHETRSQALARGMADEAHDSPAAAVRDADLAVYCAPILSIPELVKASLPGLRTRCILTDVGSTKAELACQVAPLLCGTEAVFIGSHPIAGSEQQGLEAARADLYDGAVVVVTPEGAPRAAADEVRDFWQGLGSVVRMMTAQEHDRMMARTSHLPHVIAAVLAGTVGREGDLAALGEYCGTGFRDTTRIAEGSPAVWHDVLRSNLRCIGEEIQAYSARLAAVAEALKQGDFQRVVAMLEEGRERRRRLVQSRGRDDRGGGP